MRKLGKIGILLTALSMAVVTFSGVNKMAKQADATDYELFATFDFLSNCATGNASTQLNDDTLKTLLNKSCDVSSLVTSVTGKSGDVYNGKGNGGDGVPNNILKIGKASGPGSFNFTIGGSNSISKISFIGYGWKTTTTLAINNSATQSPSSALTKVTFDYVLSSASKTISVNVTTSAFCVETVHLYKEVSAGPALSSISVKTAPTKTSYLSGEEFDAGGLVITATYDDKSTKDIAYSGNETKFSFNPTTITQTGNVAITYGGKTCTQAVSLITLTSIELGGSFEKNQIVDSEWDPTGVTVTATYSDESTENIPLSNLTSITFIPGSPTSTSISSVNVSVEYGGMTDDDDFDVNVVEKPKINRLSIKAASKYHQDGDYVATIVSNEKGSFDTPAFSVEWLKNNSSYNVLNSYDDIRIYQYHSMEFKRKQGYLIDKIVIECEKDYANIGGSSLVNATSTSSNYITTLTVTDNTESIYFKNSSQARAHSISVYYSIESFSPLDSIEVKNPETEYNVGDQFVKPTVIATFEDLSTKDVTNDSVFTGYNLSTKGSQTVNVSYTQGDDTATDSYSIVVKGVHKVTISGPESLQINSTGTYSAVCDEEDGITWSLESGTSIELPQEKTGNQITVSAVSKGKSTLKAQCADGENATIEINVDSSTLAFTLSPKYNTSDSDGSQITTSEPSDFYTTGLKYIESVTGTGGVYLGKSSMAGFKLGGGSSQGKILNTVNSNIELIPVKISFDAAPFSNKSDVGKSVYLSINGQTTGDLYKTFTLSSTQLEYQTFEIELSMTSAMLTFEIGAVTSSNNRFYLKNIKVYTDGPAPVPPEIIPLDIPTNLDQDDRYIVWDSVPNASSYSMIFGDETITNINTNLYEIPSSCKPGDYEVSVKAVGDGKFYSDSEFCDSITVTVDLPIIVLPDGNYVLRITSDDFYTSSYDTNNGPHTSFVVDTKSVSKEAIWISRSVSNSSGIQFKKAGDDVGKLHNHTSFGTIKKVLLSSTDDEYTEASNFVVYYGDSPSPTSNTICGGSYFSIVNTSSNANNLKYIEVYFTIGSDTSYSINYNANGGVNPPTSSSGTWKQDVTVKNIGEMTKTGYSFVNWTTNADGTGDVYNPGDTIEMGENNITLYAQWSINSYDVAFDKNGAKEANPATQNINYGGYVANPGSFTKDGYSLLGWKVQGTDKIWMFDADTVSESMTLVAQWSAVTYTITYNDSIGDPVDNPTSYTIETDTITLISPSKSGYEFLGWYDAATSGNKVEQIVKGSTGNKILYAQWKQLQNTHTVSFNSNGGSTIDPRECVEGSTLDLTTIIPTKAGSNFAGWLYGGEIVKSVVVTKDMTLKAQWIATDIATTSVETEANFKYTVDASSNIKVTQTSIRMYLTVDKTTYSNLSNFKIVLWYEGQSVEFTNYLLRDNGDSVTFDVALNTTGYESDVYTITLVATKGEEELTTIEAEVSYIGIAETLWFEQEIKGLTEEQVKVLEQILGL